MRVIQIFLILNIVLTAAAVIAALSYNAGVCGFNAFMQPVGDTLMGICGGAR